MLSPEIMQLRPPFFVGGMSLSPLHAARILFLHHRGAQILLSGNTAAKTTETAMYFNAEGHLSFR